jgi:hypothetical protein
MQMIRWDPPTSLSLIFLSHAQNPTHLLTCACPLPSLLVASPRRRHLCTSSSGARARNPNLDAPRPPPSPYSISSIGSSLLAGSRSRPPCPRGQRRGHPPAAGTPRPEQGAAGYGCPRTAARRSPLTRWIWVPAYRRVQVCFSVPCPQLLWNWLARG